MKDEIVGRIKRVPLRDVWPHEAYDFTNWLRDNIDVLNEILDVELSGAEKEQNAGEFKVDLLAEDSDGNPVVIENQLHKSDHSHLGKLITYKTALDAKMAIWIVSEPAPEHIGAISWLNESSDSRFYLVKAEAIKIGESPPAPLLTLIVGPTEESKQIGETRKDLSGRFEERYRFWASLLERAKKKTKLFSNRSPSKYHYIGTGAGKRGLTWNLSIGKNEAWVDLYIDRGKGFDAENKKIFDELYNSKDEIEQIYGGSLEWQRLERKRACRILGKITIGGRSDEDKWEGIQDAMIDSVIRLEKAIGPRIRKMNI